MNQKVLYGVAFFTALVTSTILGHYTRDRVTKKIDRAFIRASRATTVQTTDVVVINVPEIESPESVRRFNAASVSVDFSATLLANGSVSEITPHSGLFYEVVVRDEQRFPRVEDHELVTRVRDDIIRVVTEQIRGMKFSPQVLDGKPVSSHLQFLAKFNSLDVYARGEHGLLFGGNIELTIESESGVIWQGNVAARDHSCLID